ncbi:universal stress protein [Chromohalobacter nigrandesensis]|uniref:universal stress protein n=1 Tax=Chromohalobacter nigrandesensis TaxID=119863 RepID=UPI00248BE95E|nr:universal stress protein [Chromohalobacter nigrandesensis]
MTRQIFSCVGGRSPFIESVCDATAWASNRLAVPSTLLNVIEKERTQSPKTNKEDALREKMDTLDKQRIELMHEHAQQIMKEAMTRLEDHSVADANSRIREGNLIDILEGLDDEMRMMVIGKRGDTSLNGHLGSRLEQVIRVVRHPVLVVQQTFTQPRRIMLAFDGSVSTVKGVRMVAESPLLNGIECDVVMIGGDTDEHREQMEWARNTLEDGHVPVRTHLTKANNTTEALKQHALDNDVDMMVMGAYGHSRLRHWLVGSTTTEMLLNSPCAMLVLR